LGLVVSSVLIYSQTSFSSHAKAYDQALKETTTWENRLTDILTIKGRINGVNVAIKSVFQMDKGSADSVRTIEQAVSDLQAAGVQHGVSVHRMGMNIDRISLASMRTVDELRRNNLDEARLQAQNVLRITGEVSPVVTELERQITLRWQASETERQNAVAGINRGRGIAVSVLFVLAVTAVGFLSVGLSNLLGWTKERQPQHSLATASRGFSLVELLMVVGITLVLSTIAIANIAAVVSSSRIRAGISSMSGLLQNCRMLAVKKNKTLTAHVTLSGSGSLMGYVKDAADSSPLSTTDTQVKWEAPVVRMTVPTGPGAPAEISTTVLGYTAQTGDISFNSRGLPCAYSSGVCTNYGFLYYFKDTSRAGAKGWAALSVSPAGKIKKWYWNIDTWTF
jgi:prepilin-type N-terminal cleavage/methylation domain-containing protein